MTVLRYAPSIAWQSVQGDVVIVDLSRRSVVALNPVASFAWPQLEGKEVRDISDAVSEQFDVSADQAGNDMAIFVTDMLDRGLLVQTR